MVTFGPSAQTTEVGGGFGVDVGRQRTDIAEESEANRAEEVRVPTGIGDVPTWIDTVAVSGKHPAMDVHVCPSIAVWVHTEQPQESVLTGPKLVVICKVVL